MNEDRFWQKFITEIYPLNGTLVSARSFFPEVGKRISLQELIQNHNVWADNTLVTQFWSEQKITTNNKYSYSEMIERDKHVTDRFHLAVPKIVHAYPSFIDQLRCIHYLGMAGNEDVMLYPSQSRRLKQAGVEDIAGKIRTIQTGFADFRFNAPSVNHLEFFLTIYATKIEDLISDVSSANIYDFVSFAQYYFTVLHPFYERCGRTSEDLIYPLFEQTDRESILYISKTGWRESPLSREREHMINDFVEDFNRRIAELLGVNSSGIQKTPDIYRALTEKYFPDKFEETYGEEPKRPFYYEHVIPEVIDMYYFAMESLLYDELCFFDLNAPHKHIVELGRHLKEKGHRQYTFQGNNKDTVGSQASRPE